MNNPLVPEFLVLLRLTAEYVAASEALIEALLGKVPPGDVDAVAVEVKQRVDAYYEASGALKTFAQAREAQLS